jgi:hypothetical protein
LAIRKVGTKIIVVAAWLVCTFFVNGCGSTRGQIYQKADTIPENMGMVYIYYRPSRFPGRDVTYDVKVGETTIVTLYNGGYFPYLSKPGEVEFSIYSYRFENSVTLEIKAGETYYIQGTERNKRFHLMLVSQEVAESEISQCKLIPDPTVLSGSEALVVGTVGVAAGYGMGALMFAPLLITPACFF